MHKKELLEFLRDLLEGCCAEDYQREDDDGHYVTYYKLMDRINDRIEELNEEVSDT